MSDERELVERRAYQVIDGLKPAQPPRTVQEIYADLGFGERAAARTEADSRADHPSNPARVEEPAAEPVVKQAVVADGGMAGAAKK
jgi:hypothetical protein